MKADTNNLYLVALFKRAKLEGAKLSFGRFAKSAVVSLTRSLAISFAEDGIRVNAIAPGWIKTEFSRAGRENPEFNRKVVARIPGGEWAEAEDLAGTAIFLASPAAKLINGATIPVDGGYIAS